ncbi:MAG: cobyrinate a,c-diamide synthase [Pseudomonadota bacterium]
MLFGAPAQTVDDAPQGKGGEGRRSPSSLSLPRLVIAGLAGDSGKTVVSLGLLAAWRKSGLVRRFAVFKKGPDYIDAAWLGWAAGSGSIGVGVGGGGGMARNLDVHLMGEETVTRSFVTHAVEVEAEVSLIEGNRGLYDGLDAAGSASTAALAKLLRAPVLLVVSVPKTTATVAALVLGCQKLDPGVDIAGVVLNRVAGARHERVCREAIERHAGIPVLGAIPRFEGADVLPGRHLGLVTPAEHPSLDQVRDRIGDLVANHVDIGRLLDVARAACPLSSSVSVSFVAAAEQVATEQVAAASDAGSAARRSLSIGYFRDSAFTFYYPENLEALERAGAVLQPISALTDPVLPPIDLLYIGGGFPETHAEQLAANRALMDRVKAAVEDGLPVYAECGGLMYLAEQVKTIDGKSHRQSGVLPIGIEVSSSPRGHGYCELCVDTPNPFFAVGTELRGHEFHYSHIVAGQERVASAYAVTRGTGCFGRRDGLTYRNVLASYAHLHALGAPEWAESLCRSARIVASATTAATTTAAAMATAKACVGQEGRKTTCRL